MQRTVSEKIGLQSSVVATLLYFGNLLVLGALQPGYSHMRQFASELGMADAANPRVFGAMSVLTGAVFFVTAFGVYRATKRLTERSALSAVIGIFIALFGVNLIFAGLFPLPNPLHSAFGVALFTFMVPWLIAWAFWRFPSARFMSWTQIFTAFVIIGTAVLQTGLAGGVDDSNIGMFQRIAAGIFFVWLVATCLWLGRSSAGE